MFYLHGLGESGLCFERLMIEPRLDTWQHVAPDLPGYGKSLWPRSAHDFTAQAAALAAWLTARRAEPVILVGHSMGGVVGTLLAEQAPHLVRALVNVEGNISADDCTLSAEVAAQSFEEGLDGGFETIFDRVYQAGVEARPQRGYYASLRFCDPRVLYRDSVELVRLSEGEGLALRLGGLANPTVYLLGAPGGTGLHSRGLLDDAGVLWRAVPDAGHWPYLDRHDRFVDELVRFLESLP